MKSHLRLLMFLLTILVACNEQHKDSSQNVEEQVTVPKEPKVDPKEELLKLVNLWSRFDSSGQILKTTASKPSEVVGREGTVIKINPSDLTTKSGNPLGKVIEVELKELTNQFDLLQSNTPTVSNGDLLVSGGAYYINLTSNGEPLKLKENKKLKVQFPIKSDEEMQLFYGTRDSLEQLNWEEANESLKFPQETEAVAADEDVTEDFLINGGLTYDTATEKAKENHRRLSKKLYEETGISKLGWINVDRFLKMKNRTNLTVQFNDSDSLSFVNTFVIFEDINSVIQSFFITGQNKENSFTIPIGSKVHVISYSTKDETILASSLKTVVKENQKVTLPMKVVNEQELVSLMKK
ncbi:hypothetical protein RCC89_12650 [Cytophagaceae bacterium ABcell3]|nr:hypothetical protein RCC89_12650 [Cytophagaceae bacterium ABcell3]